MEKRFSVVSVGFNKFGVWDNKVKTRTAWFTEKFNEVEIEDYVAQLNAKYKSK